MSVFLVVLIHLFMSSSFPGKYTDLVDLLPCSSTVPLLILWRQLFAARVAKQRSRTMYPQRQPTGLCG